MKEKNQYLFQVLILRQIWLAFGFIEFSVPHIFSTTARNISNAQSKRERANNGENMLACVKDSKNPA